MDVKDLNKSQLILLAILISFITSIATGITTVTLMQQAPTSITVPVNKIIRQTVEKMVPVPGKETVQTVVVKEEDLVVDAIEKNQKAVFSIYKEAQNEDGTTVEVSAGRGFAVSNEGIIAVDGSLVPDKAVYFVKNESGKFKADFISSNKNKVSLLRIGAPLDEKNKIAYTVPSFGDINKLKTGQKILVLGNTISSFIFDGDKDMKINTNKSNAGGMILDLDGNVLGIALTGETLSFASIDSINEALKATSTVKSENKTI